LSDHNSDGEKAKFLVALGKKRKANSPKVESKEANSRPKGSQTSGNTQKIFRRKSGSS
jgi:hypothetical protein